MIVTQQVNVPQMNIFFQMALEAHWIKYIFYFSYYWGGSFSQNLDPVGPLASPTGFLVLGITSSIKAYNASSMASEV